MAAPLSRYLSKYRGKQVDDLLGKVIAGPSNIDLSRASVLCRELVNAIGSGNITVTSQKISDSTSLVPTNTPVNNYVLTADGDTTKWAPAPAASYVGVMGISIDGNNIGINVDSATNGQVLTASIVGSTKSITWTTPSGGGGTDYVISEGVFGPVSNNP